MNSEREIFSVGDRKRLLAQFDDMYKSMLEFKKKFDSLNKSNRMEVEVAAAEYEPLRAKFEIFQNALPLLDILTQDDRVTVVSKTKYMRDMTKNIDTLVYDLKSEKQKDLKNSENEVLKKLIDNTNENKIQTVEYFNFETMEFTTKLSTNIDGRTEAQKSLDMVEKLKKLGYKNPNFIYNKEFDC